LLDSLVAGGVVTVIWLDLFAPLAIISHSTL
jgi:hypothetical protein